MAKTVKNLMAGFTSVEQVPTRPAAPPQPRRSRDHREGKTPFTVWLPEDMVAQLRDLSKALVKSNGRANGSIERLVTEGINHVFEKHGINRLG